MEDSKKNSDELSASFIFSIIHDLKNMMVPIMSRAEMLQLPNLSEDKRQYMLKQLSSSCYTMMEALNKMVGICHYRCNLGKSNLVAFNLRFVVDEVLDVQDEACQHKNLTVVNDVEEKCLVLGDRESILLTLSNLIGNAVKFTPKGGEIHIFTERVENGVRVTVKDTGVGIDEKRMADVIENNNYFTTPGTEGETGTGFGILLCVTQLRHCNSKLEFANNPKGGASFSFVLETEK